MKNNPANHAGIRVSMRDIDLYGHVHNSVYLDYCEDAVVDFLRDRGSLSHFRHTTSGVAYHVKKAEITFHSPLQVDDVVFPQVEVAKIGNSSVIFEINLFKQDAETPCATGQLVWVCVSLESGKPMAIPEQTRSSLLGKPDPS